MSPTISQIGLENFKSFRDYTTIDFSNLTIVSGLNSSGKSSIYQVLLALSQSFGNYLSLKGEDGVFWKIPYLKANGELIELGVLSELLNDNNEDITIELFWDDDVTTRISYRLMKYKKYEKKKSLWLSGSHYEEPSGALCGTYNENGKWDVYGRGAISFANIEVATMLNKHITTAINKQNNVEFESSIWPFKYDVIFKDVKSINFSGFYVDNFTIDIDSIYDCVEEDLLCFIDKEVLKKEILSINGDSQNIDLINGLRSSSFIYNIDPSCFTYLPPFRGFPKRIYSSSDENRLDASRFHSESNVPYFFDFENNSARTGSLKDAVNYWIVEHFKLADEVFLEEPIPDLVSEIFLRFKNKKVPINNVGFGTSQIIPVIFEVLSSQDSMLTIVDEPEIHLHPSAQSKLADFFFHMSLLNRRIYVETHSEYLIDKIIYLNLKYSEFESDIRMLWVNNDKDSASVDNIKYDELGFIINAPEGFLSEKNLLSDKISQIRFEKI